MNDLDDTDIDDLRIRMESLNQSRLCLESMRLFLECCSKMGKEVKIPNPPDLEVMTRRIESYLRTGSFDFSDIKEYETVKHAMANGEPGGS